MGWRPDLIDRTYDLLLANPPGSARSPQPTPGWAKVTTLFTGTPEQDSARSARRHRERIPPNDQLRKLNSNRQEYEFFILIGAPAMFRLLNRVFTRILLLAVLAVSLLAGIGFMVIHEGQSQLFEQKKNDIRHIVETAAGIVAEYGKRAAAGEMTTEQAQDQAKRALSAMRFEGQEYIFVFDAAGNVLVNPAITSMIGTNRFNVKDP